MRFCGRAHKERGFGKQKNRRAKVAVAPRSIGRVKSVLLVTRRREVF